MSETHHYKIPDLPKFDVIDRRLGRYANIRDLWHALNSAMDEGYALKISRFGLYGMLDADDRMVARVSKKPRQRGLVHCAVARSGLQLKQYAHGRTQEWTQHAGKTRQG